MLEKLLLTALYHLVPCRDLLFQVHDSACLDIKLITKPGSSLKPLSSLQLALDILHKKEDRDLITGLKSRTNAGRPNWDKVFTKLRAQNRGEITVFYCGNPTLAKVLRSKCEQFGFKFRKEVF